ASAETELQGALERRAAAEEGLVGVQQTLEERRGGLRGEEATIAELRTEREGVGERLAGLRGKEAALKQDAAHLAETFREEFDRELSAEPVGEEPESAEGEEEAAPELAELEAELARTKATLERLGPVNVLAVEEYEEQQERHGFLTEQR